MNINPLKGKEKLSGSLTATAMSAVLGIGMLVPSALQAADIYVDGVFGDAGACILANAIAAAENDAVSGNCPAGAGADTIHLTQDLFIQVLPPSIQTDMTIEGHGYTIDASTLLVGGDPVFQKTVETTTLTVNDLVITGSPDTAITNRDGYMYLNNCTIDGNDGLGGIQNYLYGTLVVTNSTISNNTTTGYGGGILAPNTESVVILNNTTVTGNQAASGGGGILIADSDLGDGQAAELQLNNSLVSGNTAAGNGDEIYNSDGVVTTAGGYNLLSDSSKTTAEAFVGFTLGANNYDASSDANNDALSVIFVSPPPAAPADNDGDSATTPNYALACGSPALDLDTSGVGGVSDDQEGQGRPVNVTGAGAYYDAGSYELQTTCTAPCRTLSASGTCQWYQISPSCDPGTTGVVAHYGDDISGSYCTGVGGTGTWSAWDDAYSFLSSGASLTLGEGYWMCLTSTACIDTTCTGTTTTESCSNYDGSLSGQCYAIPVTNTDSTLDMIGNPFPYSVNWNDVRVACKNGSWSSLGAPASSGVINGTYYTYNGSAYQTLGAAGDTLDSQTGYWVSTESGSSTTCPDGIMLLIPAQ